MVAPAVHGALAPDPARQTPPRAKLTPLREAPGLRRREASWKDEVRERVQRRRRKKGDPELPLFDASITPPPAHVDRTGRAEPEIEGDEPSPAAEPRPFPGPSLLGEEPPAVEPAPSLTLQASPAAYGAPAQAVDLPLRSSGGAHRIELPEPEDPLSLARSAPLLEEEAEPEDWIPRVDAEPAPVERPAGFAERFQAGAVDLGLLLVLYAIVLYFASRTAQAGLPSLLRSWPWLVGYLVFLGLAYAVWFTGTTGQTPGKMLFGLRVVERRGQPPGYARALLRAACGAASSALLGLGVLPLFFDPARRALHDRLLRTRVVKF
jgi:uncharacterized RDD family membrane protein YckC